jgi:oxygen-dependent protoporphyrinogen oxidase
MAVERVLILGGGVSGLATAYFLARRGIPATIVEKTTRTGGLIQTELVEGCQLEAGPDSFIATKPAVRELAEELPGLKERIIGSNDAARRIFVVRDGKLVPMPKGMAMMVPGEWEPLEQSALISAEAKQRIRRETEMKPRERHEDISVGQLVEEHFGSEVLEYLTEPLLCGVYGGESESLSAGSVLPRFMGYERQYGSLVKGVQQELRGEAQAGSLFLSFRDGMQTLTDGLAAAIAGRVNIVRGEASAVTRQGDCWRVRVGTETLAARRVVLCCPAPVNAGLLEEGARPLAEQLAAIPYSSAILVMLVYDRAALGHALDGFGFLVPRAERKTIAASTWVNTKFPLRVKPGLAALRAFIVGRRAVDLAGAPEADIVGLVRDDYQRLMGITVSPLFHTLHRWPNSMPQYVVGHAARVDRIFKFAADCPGLFLGGNAFDGVGIPDCLRRARQIAQRIGENSV